MSNKALAASINAAIDELLKAGPIPSTLGLWMDTLGEALDSAAPTAEQGYAPVLRANDQFLARVIEVQGIPVSSIVAIEGGEASKGGSATKGIGMEGTFEQLEPLIRRAHANCQAHIKRKAEPFRNEELEEALTCFEQWARSIPAGGTKDKAYREAAREVRQSLKAFPKWSERFYYAMARNFINEVEALAAEAKGAIAAIWHCRSWPNEAAHEHHNGKVYLIRGSWAIAKGLIDDTGATFTDELPRPGNDNCMCSYQYISHLRSLPLELLSPTGKVKLAEARTITGAILKGEPVPHLEPESIGAIGRLLASFKKRV